MERDKEHSPERKIQRKHSGAATYKSKFDAKWMGKYPVKPSKLLNKCFCLVCAKDVSCAHQGEADVRRHTISKTHSDRLGAQKGQSKLLFLPRENPIAYKVSKAEVVVTNFIVENNLPIAVSDKMGPLFKSIFPDSQIAKNYQCARTKTFCILNQALAPSFHETLVNMMKSSPYTLATDGSNDSDLKKMNPVTVRIYDVSRNEVTGNFLDTTQGATAAHIFDKIDRVLADNNIPWGNCVGFSVDNASVNLGKRNSIKTRVNEKNQHVYFMGCPCHMAHNAAHKGGVAFSTVSKFDVEDLVVDMFYWFDKSTKRKNELNKFCVFCDRKYRQVLKHVSTRWLSLEKAVSRTLQMYQPLKSYFRSGNEQPRFQRLAATFEDPMTEVYLLFYQFVLVQFVAFSLFLQREEPSAHLVEDEITSFLRKFLTKFVEVKAIKDVTSLVEIDLTNPENLMPTDKFQIGFLTRQKVRQLESQGDISTGQLHRFLQAAMRFYTDTAMYIIKTFPFGDDVLHHSKFINFSNRLDASFQSVEFFVQSFPQVLSFTPQQMDWLADEFHEFQLMDDMPDDVQQAAKVVADMPDGDKDSYYRMDVVWGIHIRDQCPMVFQAARVGLLIPHSNAEEERVFSMVRKNKTESRSVLESDGSLSAILKVKLNNKVPSHKYEPQKALVQKSKKVTWEYNKEHMK